MQKQIKKRKFFVLYFEKCKSIKRNLFIFELNANVYFFIQTNILSIIVDIFEIAANHIYDLKKNYRFFRIKVLKKKIFKIEKKKSNEKKKFRPQNSFEQKIMFLK